MKKLIIVLIALLVMPSIGFAAKGGNKPPTSTTLEDRVQNLEDRLQNSDLDNDGFTPALGDCNDADANINPGVADILGDNIDNNCDGNIDECYPTQEVCDGFDNDCNGQIDDGLTLYTYYLDADSDGYGDGSNSIQSCGSADGSYVANSLDCNDQDHNVNPSQLGWFNAPDSYGSFDYNCDGIESKYNETIGSCSLVYGVCEGNEGWSGAVPDCGQWSDYIADCNFSILSGGCVADIVPANQACH